MKKHIPNMLTCCNLLCGSMAVLMATEKAFIYAFAFICIGAFFDFFDGLTARALKVSGRLGLELDSLADDITFGLAPAMVLMSYLRPLIGWWSLLALLMAAFSALRLAKFNIDERQTTSFIGLATPANALFWSSLCCMPYAITTPVFMPWVMLCMSFVSCFLLVCEIPFFSLKFKTLTWTDNSVRYIFLIGCLVLIALCSIEAIRYGKVEFAMAAGAACIVWYCIVNILNLITTPKVQ